MGDDLICFNLSQTVILRKSADIDVVYFSRTSPQLGDIYFGTVSRLLPIFNAAFIQLNACSLNGFLHFHDLAYLKKNSSEGEIKNYLVLGQQVLVQVIKEATGTKGPRLTMNIALTGRFLTLLPFGSGISCSTGSHIKTPSDFKNIIELFIKIFGNFPFNSHLISNKQSVFGLLIRPLALSSRKKVLLQELHFLITRWFLIKQRIVQSSTLQLISQDFDYIHRVFRDLDFSLINTIFLDSFFSGKQVFFYLNLWGLDPEFIHKKIHIFLFPNIKTEAFLVNSILKQLLKPKIFLPSGGSIILHPTEAFIAIDVNSGSYLEDCTLRASLLQINFEAAKEIAMQLRLRNLSGGIVIDFIDMNFLEDQKRLLLFFSHCLSKDEAKPQIIQLSELGFIEVTRRRFRSNLYEISYALHA